MTPWRIIQGRNVSKGDVRVYRVDGTDVAVKDYGRRPLVVRNVVGRYLVRREAAAYEAARGLPGLPEFLGRIGPFALATRWVDAPPLSSFAAGTVDPRVFERVGAVLDALHQRGIALSDLHHRDVLVGPGHEVHLVDLATSVVARDGAGPIRRALFRRFRDADRVALARMRARWTGADEREAIVTAAGTRAATLHAWARRIKAAWDLLRRRSGS
jgi:hypothetical protein